MWPVAWAFGAGLDGREHSGNCRPRCVGLFIDIIFCTYIRTYILVSIYTYA